MSLNRFASAVGFAVGAVILTAATPFMLTTDGSLEESVVVEEMARSQVAAGDRHMLSRQFGSAETAYRVAADLDRLQRRLPEQALRRVANARYFQGDYAGASATLTQLADEAAAAGARSVEFWAAIDAAYMDRLAGDQGRLSEDITRAHLLLEDAFSPERRAEVEGKVTDRHLRAFTPHLGSW